ncbi:hypothetical protein [Streptomyces sp. SP18CS02]|uniref:hypothetical protein n=1 Tax=Streptomyces sp. SP18CS02 TaxID=3002531 RepID=UPI002E79D411|nr:hypothetical protein [Streptomyces sp. SP18CS02]MEE1752703.1 hypothetical protein [Streptomyces sp. SP18CS02]
MATHPVVQKPGPTTPAQPQLVQYQLPPGAIRNMSDASRAGPSQAHGVLGIPAGTGPHPVVVVVHGNHTTCVIPGAKADGVVARPVKAAWPLVCADPKSKKLEEPGVGPDYPRHGAGVSYLLQALARKGFVAVAIEPGTTG